MQWQGLTLAFLLIAVSLCNASDVSARLSTARSLEKHAPEEALKICDELLAAIPHWVAVHQLAASIHCDNGRVAACLCSYEEALDHLSNESMRSSQAAHVYPTVHNYAVSLFYMALPDPKAVREEMDSLQLSKRKRLLWLREGTEDEIMERIKAVLRNCSWNGNRRTMVDCASVAIVMEPLTAVTLLMDAVKMPISPEDPISDGEVYAKAAKMTLNPGSRLHKFGEEAARKAVSLGDPSAVFSLVDYYITTGRHQDGIPILDEAVRVSPSLADDAQYWIYRSNLFGIAGNKQAAIEMLTELIARHDGEYLSSAYHNRAIDLNGLGLYRASHEDHHSAVVTSFREFTAEPSRNPDCDRRRVRAGFLYSLEGIPGVSLVASDRTQEMPVVDLQTRLAEHTPPSYREFYEEHALLPGKLHSFINMQDVELFGMSRMIVRDCDVLVPNVAMHHFSTTKEPLRGTKDTHLAGKTYIATTQKMSSNYYHLLMDVIPSLEHAVQEDSYDHILYHSSPILEQALEVMDVPRKKRVAFDPDAAPYALDEAVFMDSTGDWEAFNAHTSLEMSEDSTEGEFKFYPSLDSILAVRRAFIPAGHLPPEERSLVIYAHREPPNPRSVENADILIDALTKEFGDRFLVHIGKGVTLEEQAELFQRAVLLVGPHGAGLTNAVYMAPGSAVVELPVKRTRYFGYLAAQIDVDYWVVPEAEGLYESYYHITPSLADSITTTCREAFAQTQANVHRHHSHDEL